LKNDLAAFQKGLQPTVLADFAQAAKVARTGLHGLEPAAAGAGRALGDVLGSLGKTLQSGEFQSFFAFLGRAAGPDGRLLGQDFTDWLKTLPPLIEGLHGVSVEAFKDFDGIVRLIGGVEHLVSTEQHLRAESANSTGWMGKLAHAVGDAAKAMVP